MFVRSALSEESGRESRNVENEIRLKIEITTTHQDRVF